MAIGLFEIGRGFSSVTRTAYRALRAAVLGGGGGGDSSTQNVTATRGAGTAESLRLAGDGLRGAFDTYATKTRPVYTTTLYNGLSSSAMVNGVTARIGAAGGYSTLETTAPVNTGTTTVRSSSSALGLDVTSAEAASALRSSSALGLNLTESASTIRSTAEMNSATKSLSSYDLGFSLGSTGRVELSGAYSGSATSLTIRFDTKLDLLTELTKTTFSVLDQNNAVVASFDDYVSSGQVVDLAAIGLKLRFTSGVFLKDATATTTVSQTPTDVSTTALFNASWASAPRFENFGKVTAGSFKVNGTTVTVDANDSISSVVSRINSQVAGVTASVSGDRVVLSTTSSSESGIVLSDDTSGFLAATKLSGATTTVGNIRDDQQALSATSRFGSVATGSFTINGVSISVNKDTDSLSTLITRINNAGAGVTASFNSSTNKVELTTTSNSEDLITVAGDTSGFLAAAGLSTNNTTRGNIQDDDQVFAKTTQFNDVVTGSFVINGVSISVNKDTDSLQTLIDRVNSAGAGVTASYNSATDKVVFTPDVAGATLTIGSDTSGFLSEAQIATGTTATRANADGAFNATGASGPLFDNGLAVTAGSFTVNGVTINVAANDTINSVLGRITASAAGVDAAYDAATETTTLTSRVASATPVTVGNDTSGFLAAVKLDGTALSTPGGGNAYDMALDDMAEYAGVVAGVLTVNGQAIAIDPSTTTIRGLIASIDAVTNVTASVNDITGAVAINSAPGGSLTLSDTSGVLAKLGLTAGTVSGSVGDTTALKTQSGTKPSNTTEVVAAVAVAARTLNAAVGDTATARTRDSEFNGALTERMKALVKELEELGVGGVSVSGGDGGAPTLNIDQAELLRTLDARDKPTEARAAIGSALDRFTAATVDLASRPVADAAAPPVRSMTIELQFLPPLDRSAGQSRVSAARAAAKAGTYRKYAVPPEERQRVYEPAPRREGYVSDPVSVSQPMQLPGLFEGLFDSLLRRLS